MLPIVVQGCGVGSPIRIHPNHATCDPQILSTYPTPIDIRHVMIGGGVTGGQGCYRLTRGSTGSPPYTVSGWPYSQVLGFPLE